MIEILNIIFDFFARPIFSDPQLLKAEPITATVAVIAAVTGILKGIRFTGTPHLSFDDAAEQARNIRPAFVAQWKAENGSTGKAILDQALKVKNYFDARAAGQSWQIMAGTLSRDLQNGIGLWSIENPTQLLNYCAEIWLTYCLMNYDAARPDDFSAQLVARTKEVFKMDLSAPAKPKSILSNADGTGGAIGNIINEIKDFFSNDDEQGGGSNGGGGISNTKILLIAAAGLAVFLIIKK